MELLVSIFLFGKGIIKRSWALLPALFLDPLDAYERIFDVTVDIPAYAFYGAALGGFFVASALTYHEVRVKAGKPDVIFEVRESIFSLSNYNHNRPEQPLDMAEVTLKGRLRNRGDVGADINGVRVALMERGWFWIWRKVDEQSAIKLLNRLRAAIDLYHNGVSVDAQSSAKNITDIAEIWAYPSIPVSLKPESRRPHRLRILVDAYGQKHPSPVYWEIDLPSAFRVATANFQRINKLIGKPSESTQNTEGSRPE